VKHEVDTLVVGGGIAGLAYAHGLGADADVALLEAADRLGGLIRTGTHEDVHYEWGPEALQDNAPETMALLDELGLRRADADPAAKKRYILDASRRPVEVPTGPGAFLRSPLLSLGGKLRAFTEPWRSGDKGLDGSIADFVRHRLGRQILERLVDPAISGIYAGDPELLSFRGAFPAAHDLVAGHGSILRGMMAKGREKREAREAAGEPPQPRKSPSLLSVAGGLERLPEALGAALGGGVRTGCRLARVRRLEDGRWEASTAEGESWSARRLVLGVPAGAAGKLLEQDEPELSQQLGSMVTEAVVSLIHVWGRDQVRHPLDAFGYLVPSGLGMSHLGTLFSSSIQPERCPGERVMLRTLMGGARRPELVEQSDEQLLQIVRDEVGATLGLSGEPLWSCVVRWPAALPRYDLHQVQRQATIDALLAERPGLSIVGNHRKGISVNALIESSRSLAREHRGAHA